MSSGGCVLWPAREVRTALPDPETLLAYFAAQLQSRHLDLALRWLQSQGEAFYTIGSAGHESNAAVAMALGRDPALLHYRSGGFYAARAGQVAGQPRSTTCSTGRSPRRATRSRVAATRCSARRAHVIPQTSTIGSHLPRAFGLAFALGRAPRSEVAPPWPVDSVVVCSFGGRVGQPLHRGRCHQRRRAYCAYQRVPLPMLFVCEDNGIGISKVRTPVGRSLADVAAGPEFAAVDAPEPVEVFAVAAAPGRPGVRAERSPAFLHLRTVRFMGHAGSDAEIAYRSAARSRTTVPRSAAGTAGDLVDAGLRPSTTCWPGYETRGRRYAASRGPRRGPAFGRRACHHRGRSRHAGAVRAFSANPGERAAAFGGRLPEDEGPLTLAQSVNAASRSAGPHPRRWCSARTSVARAASMA